MAAQAIANHMFGAGAAIERSTVKVADPTGIGRRNHGTRLGIGGRKGSKRAAAETKFRHGKVGSSKRAGGK